MEPLQNPYLNSDFSQKDFSLKKIFLFILGILFSLSLIYYLFISAPSKFPAGIIFNIDNGENLRSVSLDLKNKNIIRSRLAFETMVILYGSDKHIISADYLFENKMPVWVIARRISKGERHLAPVRVTIPEGFNNQDIADTFENKLSYFNKDNFLKLALEKQGYLFPDTYFFFTTARETDVIQNLNDNFYKKISILDKDFKQSKKSMSDIIKMASVVEAEAKGAGDRDIIAGILWHRIDIGMPLQADAAPETYKNKGLPKYPINNPGLDAIRATIYPKEITYLYYLHDKTGNIHFAKTFAEHRANILKYLK